MLAIFKTGGKQYSVTTGQILKVEKLEGKKGDSVSFNDILVISDALNHTIGTPIVQGANVKAKILEQIRDKKIIVFKKRQRQNYRHTQGHRQYLTVLQIESITIGDKKSSVLKKEVTTKTMVKKTDEKKQVKIQTTTKKKATPKKNAAIKKKSKIKKTTQKTK